MTAPQPKQPTRQEQVVFAVGQGDKPGVQVVVLGVPKAGWLYMAEGRTHTFDLTKVGLPLQIMMYGAATHDEALGMLQPAMRPDTRDIRDQDMGLACGPDREQLMFDINRASRDLNIDRGTPKAEIAWLIMKELKAISEAGSIADLRQHLVKIAAQAIVAHEATQ